MKGRLQGMLYKTRLENGTIKILLVYHLLNDLKKILQFNKKEKEEWLYSFSNTVYNRNLLDMHFATIYTTVLTILCNWTINSSEN